MSRIIITQNNLRILENFQVGSTAIYTINYNMFVNLRNIKKKMYDFTF